MLLASIIGMPKSLELTVVADGVETEGQLSVLTDLGRDIITARPFQSIRP